MVDFKETVNMTNKITLELTNDEALVLFDWISRFNDKNDNDFEDQAEERVLWIIESLLEKQLAEPLSEHYDKFLESARENVRDTGD